MGAIAADQVTIFVFDKVDADTPTVVTKAEFDESGALVNWPFGFFSAYKGPQVSPSENLVPVEVCREVFAGNTVVQRYLDGIFRIEARSQDSPASENLIAYFNYKEGLSRQEIRGATGGERDFMILMWRCLDPCEVEFDCEDFPLGAELICGGVSHQLLRLVCEFGSVPRNRKRLIALLKRQPCWEEVLSLIRRIIAYGARPITPSAL